MKESTTTHRQDAKSAKGRQEKRFLSTAPSWRLLGALGVLAVEDRKNRRAFVLIAVLVVTSIAAMVAVGLLHRMRAERTAGAAMTQGEQAYAAALSGIQTALAVLTTPREGPPQGDGSGDPPPVFLPDFAEWHDNPTLFRGRFVAFDGANRWYFTVYARNDDEESKVRYGVGDESGKMILNAATTGAQLDALGLDANHRDALLDYMDAGANDATREFGAEQDYYDQLPKPYLINHAPGTVEELLFVKGFTGADLYGEDANFSGLLEPNEDDGPDIFPPDDNDGKLRHGLIDFFTLPRYQQGTSQDLNPLGLPKLDIGQASAADMEEIGLDPSTISAIEAARQAGGINKPSDLLQPNFFPDIPHDQLHLVMAYLTGSGLQVQRMINLNTAPAPVLAAFLDIEPGLAQEIVGARRDISPDERTSPVWLLARGIMDVEKFIQVAPRLKTRGYHYKVRVIGYGLPCGRYRILEAVIDTRPMDQAPVRILSLREISRVGAPFPLDEPTESD